MSIIKIFTTILLIVAFGYSQSISGTITSIDSENSTITVSYTNASNIQKNDMVEVFFQKQIIHPITGEQSRVNQKSATSKVTQKSKKKITLLIIDLLSPLSMNQNISIKQMKKTIETPLTLTKSFGNPKNTETTKSIYSNKDAKETEETVRLTNEDLYLLIGSGILFLFILFN